MYFGGVFSVVCLASIYIIEAYCRSGVGDCSNAPTLNILWMYSIIFVPVFFLSFLSKKSFESFRNTSLFFVAAHLILVTILPLECQDYIKICKETFALAFPAIYFLISLILIAYKSYRLRGK